jgi:DNA-binding IclR family transcriptional regulator
MARKSRAGGAPVARNQPFVARTVSAQIQSIERAAAVLRLLTGRSGRRGVADLANELDLPKGTVHGILRTLQAVGFVEQDGDSGKYQVGAALLHIGSSYLDGNELRRRAITWADALATQTGEGVRIGTLHEQLVLIVHHVPGPDDGSLSLGIGALLPVHITALGKALVAHPHVSDRGWASEVGELLPGTASIAAPIENRKRRVVGAVAISGAIDRLCQANAPRPELAAYVMECARAISRDLGATP